MLHVIDRALQNGLKRRSQRCRPGSPGAQQQAEGPWVWGLRAVREGQKKLTASPVVVRHGSALLIVAWPTVAATQPLHPELTRWVDATAVERNPPRPAQKQTPNFQILRPARAAWPYPALRAPASLLRGSPGLERAEGGHWVG